VSAKPSPEDQCSSDRGDEQRSGIRDEIREIPPGPLLPSEHLSHRAAFASAAYRDIPLLASHFLERRRAAMKVPCEGFTAEALEAFATMTGRQRKTTGERDSTGAGTGSPRRQDRH